MLHAPTPRRERVLLFGPPGSGKSSAWMAVAEWLHKTRSTARVHVGDTDRTWDDMAPYDNHLDKVVSAYAWHDWPAVRDTVKKLEQAQAGVDDWLVVDMVSRCWDRAQESFFEQAYGTDFDELWMHDASSRAKLIGGDYGANWQAINKAYNRLSTLIMSRWPGHVLACTPAQKVWQADQNEQTAKLLTQYPEFGRIGSRPQGQKDLPHQFRTVLYLQQAPSGWVWTTAKERNPPGSREGDEGYRAYRQGEKMEDFVKSYLMKVGGWRP